VKLEISQACSIHDTGSNNSAAGAGGANSELMSASSQTLGRAGGLASGRAAHSNSLKRH